MPSIIFMFRFVYNVRVYAVLFYCLCAMYVFLYATFPVCATFTNFYTGNLSIPTLT